MVGPCNMITVIAKQSPSAHIVGRSHLASDGMKLSNHLIKVKMIVCVPKV